MTLPAPNLDDRRFQQLVDEAKRLVQQRCPEWTDHNVSDPGVTLIETFAWMTDLLMYRLNRVPERNYIKFLELIGVRLFPPTAATAPVTFWLSAPQSETVRVPAGTEVATPRGESEEAVSFTTSIDLDIVPCSVSRVASTIKQGEIADNTAALERDGFLCFDQVPKPGDALLVGLSEAVPSCAVVLRFDAQIEGIGVDPRDPPVVWEGWDGDGWSRCEIERDETGGLNRGGDIVLHVPRSHTASVINKRRAGWIRCRVVEAEERQPKYSASPKIKKLSAFTIGGTAHAEHAVAVTGEIIGTSEGTPGQRFSVRRPPVVPSEEPLIVEVSSEDGWNEWTEASTFAESAPADRHFVLDRHSGDVSFGPAVREPDGSLRAYGATPEKGASIRLRSYRSGGGRRGNVARGALSVLKSTIPLVSRVENRYGATGGVDGEDIENAKMRGPIVLRTQGRAVTAEDYEQIARESAPEVARVRCVPATNGADAGGVRVLVVPAAEDDPDGRLPFAALVPSEDTLQAVAARLEERRVIGARVVVEPPLYQGITIVGRLRPRENAEPSRLQRDAIAALNKHFHPIAGGADGRGWPFGRPVHVGEVYSVLQRVSGVEFVEEVRLFAADPLTGQRGSPVDKVDVAPNALVYSYDHQIVVQGD